MEYGRQQYITDYIGAAVGEAFAKQLHVKLLPAECVRNLPAADTTLAEAFKEAGYTTFFAGKWHLGSKGSWPEDHGFDSTKGGWDAGSPNGGYYSPWKNPNLPSGPKGESLTQRLANETIAFIDQHKDKPFLAYLSFYAVHGPIQTTKPLWNKYREKASKQPKPDQRFKNRSHSARPPVPEQPHLRGPRREHGHRRGPGVETARRARLNGQHDRLFHR